jgi:hypothetical protein
MGLTHDIGKMFLVKAFSENPAAKNLEMKLVIASIRECTSTSIMLKRWGFKEDDPGYVAARKRVRPDGFKDCLRSTWPT